MFPTNGPSLTKVMPLPTSPSLPQPAWKSVSVCSTTSSQLANTLRLVAILLQGEGEGRENVESRGGSSPSGSSCLPGAGSRACVQT